jgi:putative spermidine/putrescine transport system ATP-binding protein
MASVELENLHKRFGAVTALKSLSLAVESGEFVSLLGPSGCGKTTALRIIAGFERADGGRVLVDGKDISGTPANRRDMGMVFQAYSLFPNMTARQNVEFGLRIRRRNRAERRARAASLLDLVGLAHALDRYPHQLSGGQQQRVALARALAIEPRVLLLDEPLSALDAKVRVQLREEIRRIQKELGITTLYVTHDQEEALSVSDGVVVLSQGQIEQVGSPAEIYGQPQTVFVAEFIGTSNRLEGLVEPGGVSTGGTVLPASPNGHRSGEQVLLLLRPEAIVVTPGAEPGGGLAGVIQGHTFLGSVTRIQVQTVVGTIVADVNSGFALSLPAGSPVSLSWDPGSTRILPVSGGAPQAESPVAAGEADDTADSVSRGADGR